MRSSHSLAAIEDSPWSAIRKNWTILTQIAAGLTTVVATIVAPPPTPVGTLGIRPFASFVVAILAGIFLLVLRRFRKQEHALLWAALAAILLVVTVVDYFWYFNLIDTRTETWHGYTIVCGTELRPAIQKKYGSIIRKSRVRELLDDATGAINLDRPINSLEQRRFVCLLSGHSSAYRRVHYGGFTDRNVQSATALSYETCEG
jgi:hypothetical protein